MLPACGSLRLLLDRLALFLILFLHRRIDRLGTVEHVALLLEQLRCRCVVALAAGAEQQGEEKDEGTVVHGVLLSRWGWWRRWGGRRLRRRGSCPCRRPRNASRSSRRSRLSSGCVRPR